MNINNFFKALLIVSLPLSATAQADDAIEFGVLPALSTRTILNTYKPVREYVEERIAHPVTLVTAPNYRTFLERTQNGEYRFVVTAPHYARLAQTEAGYIPLVRVTRELRSIFVVHKDSKIQSLEDLRNKRLSTPDATAMLTLLGRKYLRDNKLVPDVDIKTRAYTSVNSSVLAVINADSDAAITAQTALNQMPENVRNNLRVIATSPPVPHMIYLANKQVPPAEVEKMVAILLDFSADTKRSEVFFKQTGFLGYARPTDDEMKNLDPYVAELKNLTTENVND
jgi:phosphonate transport system substrate-binding protein